MAQEIKIEKGIPIPEGKSSCYPWDAMEVGDSFVVADRSRQAAHGVAVYQTKRRAPKKFKSSSSGGICRIWRTA